MCRTYLELPPPGSPVRVQYDVFCRAVDPHLKALKQTMASRLTAGGVAAEFHTKMCQIREMHVVARSTPADTGSWRLTLTGDIERKAPMSLDVTSQDQVDALVMCHVMYWLYGYAQRLLTENEPAGLTAEETVETLWARFMAVPAFVEGMNKLKDTVKTSLSAVAATK